MAEPLTQQYEKLRIIYSEIVNGYTYDEERNIYVKHLSERENGELSRKRQSLFLKLKKEGVPSEQEKLQQVIDAEMWSTEKEEEILQHKYIILDNEKNLEKIIPQQHGPILKIIEQTKEKLGELLYERRQVVGITAEECAEKDSSLFLFHLCFFTDPKLETRLFPSYSDTDELEDQQISDYSRLIESMYKKFNEETLKKVAIMPFFMNYYINCKDKVHTFFGKPIVDLTSFQLHLISLGNRNINILEQSKGEPPEIMGDIKIEDVINWYDQEYSLILGRRNLSKSV